MKENFALRLKDLRTKKGITQQELSNSLDVTTKAISKWENDGGMPDISILPKLAQIFKTTIDYLLTGEDNTKPLSLIELCAKKDDVSLYEDIPSNELFVKDETGKNLLDYVVKYESYKVFLEMFKKNSLKRLLDLDITQSRNQHNRFNRNKQFNSHPKYLDFLKLSIISNSIELIEFFNVKSHTINLSGSKKEEHTFEYFKRAITHANFKDSTLDYLLEKDSKGRIWIHGYQAFIKLFLDLDSSKPLIKVLKSALNINVETKMKCDEIIKKENDSYGLAVSFNSRNGEYTQSRRNNAFIGQSVIISKDIIHTALDKRLFDVAELMNEINTNTNAKAYIAEPFEFDSRKISDDDTISELDKTKKLISYGGIIKIDDLIAMDDYKIYKELIELPASEIEMAFDFINNEQFKELMEYAEKNDCKEIIRNIHTFDKDLLFKILASCHKPENIYREYGGNSYALLKKGHPNYSYYYVNKVQDDLPFKQMSLYEKLKAKKKIIKFSQIIDHQDKRFFDHAIKTDPENLDWALENVDPKRFDVIKKLLDAGAQLHKRWTEDDGWGYEVERDEIDKINTEILRKRIDGILEEKNE